MQPRHRKSMATGVVVLATAVISSVLGGISPTVAAPSPDRAAATAGEEIRASSAKPPSVWPRPQTMRARGRFAAVTPAVTLVAPHGSDPYALELIESTLRSAGAEKIGRTTPGAALPEDGTVVYADGTGADTALRALNAPGADDLPPGGYRLAAGEVGDRAVVALSGVGPDGLFHAAQTLRQLATGQGFAGVVVRDWATAAVRGTAENFYGAPWTHEQRLSQLDFMGRTKQNRYLYAPGDDSYRQSLWSEPYPTDRRARFRELAERARSNHVTLTWAVAPGRSMCFTSEKDRKALLRKVDTMWELGFRSFQLQFQDVSYTEWHCADDADEYGSGSRAAAHAQASVADELSRHLTRRYGQDRAALSLLPTEYYQEGSTDYRDALARTLHPAVEVAWTGVGVLPEKITGRQIAEAGATLRHSLLTMDNYPVNDFAEDRIFLGPYRGREPAVAVVSAGVLAAAMRQPAVSRIPLFTAADYAWNPRGYDPQASWKAAINDLAGPDGSTRAALRALAGNDASSVLDDDESAYLRPLMEDFWAAHAGTGEAGREEAARRLRSAFSTMRQAPQRLEPLADGSFGEEAGPWLDQLARHGAAGEAAVDLLLAQARGDGAAAWRIRLTLERARTEIAARAVTVGDGVLDPFLLRVLAAADSWAGVGGDGRLATTSMDSARSTDPAAMTDGKDTTVWSSDVPPQEDDTFGLDLGASREVSDIRITMGGTGPEADNYLRDAVLEYSADDGRGWRRVGTYRDRKTVEARLPEDSKARYVRLRSGSPQETAVTVREFAVTLRGTERRTAVTGSPAAVADTTFAAASDGDLTTAYRAEGTPAPGEALTVEFDGTHPLDALTVLTTPASGPHDALGSTEYAGPATDATHAVVEARVPGEGWRRLGALGDGWSEFPAAGVRADAVRLLWSPGSATPEVHEIVPWFADASTARMTLDSPTAVVETGGKAVEIRATLHSVRPGETRASLVTTAPKGVEVTSPGEVVLGRGEELTTPLRISAPADTKPGSYVVPVRFTVDGRTMEQRITVRVGPRTGGPDLLQGAAATSSGDETPDYPASAMTDGRADTRWSSQVTDDAWVQAELPEPARIGRVDVHWQEAHATRYRVETSVDGITWRTAAEVRDSKGSHESVRLDDTSETRFIRIRGIERATKYSYSLWSVRAYAVTP